MINQYNKNKIDTKSQISQIHLFRDHSQNNLRNKIIEQHFDEEENEKINHMEIGLINNRFNNNNVNNNSINNVNNNTNNNSNRLLGSKNSIAGQSSKFTFHNNNINNIYPTNDKQINSINPQNIYFHQQTTTKHSKLNNTLDMSKKSSHIPPAVNNFQSTRIQSLHCLQQLSLKLQNQLSRLDYKIQHFHQTIHKFLTIQLSQLKQRTFKILQQTFKQTQKIIKQYINQQQNLLAKQIIQNKKILEKQYEKVQSMKYQIGNSNMNKWRKAVGELIASQMEQKIQSLLKDSKSIEIGIWKEPTIFQDKINHFQKSVKLLVSLNYDQRKDKDK